jgi:ABC-type multidrug transport system ATPase subunit
MLDEPLNGIDPFTADTIISVLHKRWKKDGMSIIMTAHSMSAWPELNAVYFTLSNGRVELTGTASAAAHGFKNHVRYIHAE